ncbi:hypothetical protein FQA39_LY05615 [Lamprigera yunnana]|nr:hypothetical protein FQA39_LY05615 [Lamprigera yunnana]
MFTQSPNKNASSVEVKEEIVKHRRPDNFAAPSTKFKLTHHTVAPSDVPAAKFPVEDADANKDKKKPFILPSIFRKKSKEDSKVEDTQQEALPEVGNVATGCIDVAFNKIHISENCSSKQEGDEIDEKAKAEYKLPNTIEHKVFKLGESGSGIKPRGAIQDFYELRDHHFNSGTLFEDPEFPADDSSLNFSRRPDRRYEWLRPGEIVDNPQLFVEGYSRFDVQQGELGDCWLLAAVANLTLYRRLFFQIVPDDQGFDENYAGIFHFRFWQYGRWIDVVIDDRLPTYRGQLVYLHSNEENEFWSALLEKAYAKLHGSYEALKGGSTCEAMEDFTGGVTEMYELNAAPPNLFKIVLKAYERGSLMGASLEPDPGVLEAETPEGLIRGHAYSITRVKYVDIQTPHTVGKIPLLRLRNPWGNEMEWNGAWSDKSPEWRFIPDHEKENLGLTFDSDGEFWMSYKDFQKHFDRLEICNLTPDSLTEEEISQGDKKQWEMSVFEGEWVRGVTAGGCRNNLETFCHNPQYRITLTDVDEDDDENKCTVIIALMQKNRRLKRQQVGMEFLTIGFAVYYLPNPNAAPKPLNLNYFKYNASVARSPSFINLREVSCRFMLPPGTYCIVPSTFDPNEEGEFLLRVFSEHKNNMEYGSSHNYEHDSNHSSSSDHDHHDNRYNYNPPRGYTAVNNFNPGGYSNFFGSGGLFDFSSFSHSFFQNRQPNYAPPPAYNRPQQQYSTPNYRLPHYSTNQPPQYSNPNYPRPTYPPQNPHYSNPPYPPAQYQPPPYPTYMQPNQSYPPPPGYRPQNPNQVPIPKTPVKIIPKEKPAEVDEVHQQFLKLAGDDMEIDWQELKGILDFAVRTELQLNKISVRGVEAGIGSSGNTNNSFLGLICMPLCKSTPTDVVPNAVAASTVHVAPPSKGCETKNMGFSKDTCRSIVALLDKDRSGKLGFEEFKQLWSTLKKSKTVFHQYDKDNTGTLNGFELREALNSVGYILNNKILNVLMHRYGNKKAEITYDDFIVCGLKLKCMIEGFQQRNKANGKSITVTFDDWIETTLYA